MIDPLAWLEDEMAVAAAEAVVRLRVAQAWLRSADTDLGALRAVTWGGPVDQWHRAAAAVTDASEAVAAFERFGLLSWHCRCGGRVECSRGGSAAAGRPRPG